MNRKLFSIIGAAVVTAGLGAAQTPAPADPNAPPAAGQQQRARGMRRAAGARQRMAQNLNLTDAQKEQARAIFQQSKAEGQPIAQQLKQVRQDLKSAVTTNAPESEINRLSARVGELSGQLAAIRSRGFAKFYGILTPEQRAKADEGRAGRMKNIRGGRGLRRAAPPAAVQQ